MNNRCPDQKDLQRFADRELKEPRRSSVAQHVSGCERCARELKHLQRLGELVSGAIRKETEGHNLVGLWGDIRAGISAPAQTTVSWQTVLSLLWRPAARVAYAAFILLLASFFVAKSLFPPTGRGPLTSVSTKPPEATAAIRQARVDSVSTYNAEVTVSVLLAYKDNSAIVWISGLEGVEKN